jgi:enoyl-CoA hydratase/carnithine racemase
MDLLSGAVSRSALTGEKSSYLLAVSIPLIHNSDMVVASPDAQFGLPEVAVGLYAAAGGLPRVIRIVGLQLASELAMTGRRLSAQEAFEWRLINRVAKTPGSVVQECLDLAGRITSFSPDGIIVSRQGLREGEKLFTPLGTPTDFSFKVGRTQALNKQRRERDRNMGVS